MNDTTPAEKADTIAIPRAALTATVAALDATLSLSEALRPIIRHLGGGDLKIDVDGEEFAVNDQAFISPVAEIAYQRARAAFDALQEAGLEDFEEEEVRLRSTPKPQRAAGETPATPAAEAPSEDVIRRANGHALDAVALLALIEAAPEGELHDRHDGVGLFGYCDIQNAAKVARAKVWDVMNVLDEVGIARAAAAREEVRS